MMSASTTPQAAGLPAPVAPQPAAQGFGQPQAAPAPTAPQAAPFGQVPAPATGLPAAPPAPQAPAPAAPAPQADPQAGPQPTMPTQPMPVVLGPDGQPFDFERNARLIENLRTDLARVKQGHGLPDPTTQPAPTAAAPAPLPGNPAAPAPAQAPAAGDPATQALEQVTRLQQQLAGSTLRTEFVAAATAAGVRADAIDFALHAARTHGLQVSDAGVPLNLAETLERVRQASGFLFGDGTQQPGQVPGTAPQAPTPGAPAPVAPVAPWGVPNTNGGNGSGNAGGPAPVLSADEAVFASAFGQTPEQYAFLRDAPAGSRLPAPQPTT